MDRWLYHIFARQSGIAAGIIWLLAAPTVIPSPIDQLRSPSHGLAAAFAHPAWTEPTAEDRSATAVTDPQMIPTQPLESSTQSPGGIRRDRAVLWGAFSVGALYLSYRESQAAWGASNGKFHFKNDLVGDGMALNDEISHLFAAFQITEFLTDAYRWIGMEPGRARRIGAWETLALTFLTEFPIDSFNPDQGFGLSDFLFNAGGVLAAYHRMSCQHPPRWDVKISVKRQFFSGESRLIAHTNKQYDDYVYWLTFRPSRSRALPFLLGIGYSTDHDQNPGIIKELHLGIGTSLEDLGGIFGEKYARRLRLLNFFFFNIGTKITHR
jgi:hypothetical protein